LFFGYPKAYTELVGTDIPMQHIINYLISNMMVFGSGKSHS